MKLALLAAATLAVVTPQLAHAQSAALVQKPVFGGNCAAWADQAAHPNQVKDSGIQCGSGIVGITDGVHPGMGLQANFAGYPAILNLAPGKPIILQRFGASSGADGGDFQCTRAANYTGGTHGFVNPCLYSYTTVSAGTTSFEWSALARLDNYGTAADASENTAAYFQARKYGTGATWGSLSELYDMAADPISSSVTSEQDMTSFGSDTNHNRVLYDGWVRNAAGSSSTEATYAIRLNTDTGSKWGHGLYLNGGFGDGINLGGGTYDNGNALVLGTNNHLCWDSFCTKYTYYDGSSKFTWKDGANGILATLDSGTGAFSTVGPISTFASVAAGSTVTAGTNVIVNGGNKFCLDASCGHWLNFTGAKSTFANTTNGAVLNVDDAGNVAGAQSLSTFGTIAAGSSITAGTTVAAGTNFVLNAGNKYCLDASCGHWLVYSGSKTTFANSTNGAVFTVDDSGNVAGAQSLATFGTVAAGGALSGASLNVGGGSVSAGSISGSNIAASGYVQTGSGQPLYLDGGTHSTGLSFTSGAFSLISGGTTYLSVSPSTKIVGTPAGGSYAVGFSQGVSCSGAPTASFASVGGIVTHC